MLNFLTKQSVELSPQKRLWLVGLALVIGILYDTLVYKQQLGLGFFVFVNLSILLFLILAVVLKQVHQLWPLILIIPIISMSGATVIFNNNLVTYGAPWFVVILTAIFFITLTLRNEQKHKFKFLNIPIIRSIDLPFAKWAEIYHDLFKREDDGKIIYKKIAIGFIIALPIIIVFAGLFISADKIFADLIDKFFQDLPKTLPWRIFRTLAITLFLSGLFYVIVHPVHSLKEFVTKTLKSDKVVASTILILLNLLFAVFVFIQIKYLFGSSSYVFSSNYTFAEYARKGFFELVLVLIFVAIIFMIFFRSFSGKNYSRLIAILQFLFSAQTIIIAVSALKRMYLYQEIYGFTIKRLYVEWFIYFVILILAVAAICLLINWSYHRFVHLTLALGLTALTVVCLINVDKVIAKENVDRYLAKKQKEFDMNYLLNLSVDVYPEVSRVFASGYTLELQTKPPLYDDKTKKTIYYKKEYNSKNFNDLYAQKELGFYMYYKDGFEEINNIKGAKVKANYSWREYNYNRFKVKDEVGSRSMLYN